MVATGGSGVGGAYEPITSAAAERRTSAAADDVCVVVLIPSCFV